MTETLRNGKKKAVLEALRKGNTRRAAVLAVGIEEATLWRWMQTDEALCKAVKEAEAEAEQWYLDKIKEAACENWTAAAWYLERRYRADYGRYEKTEATVHVSGLERYTDEELERYARGDDAAAGGAAAEGGGETGAGAAAP